MDQVEQMTNEGSPDGSEPSAAVNERRQGYLAALDDMRSAMAVDADEVGACREVECPRPKGPHGFCRSLKCEPRAWHPADDWAGARDLACFHVELWHAKEPQEAS